jgi:hypothetical protein
MRCKTVVDSITEPVSVVLVYELLVTAAQGLNSAIVENAPDLDVREAAWGTR